MVCVGCDGRVIRISASIWAFYHIDTCLLCVEDISSIAFSEDSTGAAHTFSLQALTNAFPSLDRLLRIGRLLLLSPPANNVYGRKSF